MIDDFVTDAMQTGATQLVLLGAGYDTRATRLPAPASQILLTYVDRRFLDTTNSQAGAWSTAVHDAGEPFQTGLDPTHAKAFFAARNLTLQNDESTTQAAHRLGAPKAHMIPDMYRLATLQITPTSPQS